MSHSYDDGGTPYQGTAISSRIQSRYPRL